MVRNLFVIILLIKLSEMNNNNRLLNVNKYIITMIY
jgi:hypothetical protein